MQRGGVGLRRVIPAAAGCASLSAREVSVESGSNIVYRPMEKIDSFVLELSGLAVAEINTVEESVG
jgi:hypothetical protein